MTMLLALFVIGLRFGPLVMLAVFAYELFAPRPPVVYS